MTNTNQLQTTIIFAAAAFVRFPWWLQWLIFTLLAFILYIPVVGNSFLSDDFFIIKKVGVEGKLNTEGFFRPLSDITLWLNYQVGGLNPFVYYFTQIIIRGLSVLVLFHFCIRLQWTDDKQRLYNFSLAAALLFLTYPFHNESVAWIPGRGALIAGTCAMGVSLIATSNKNGYLKIAGACALFFTGLAAYESIIVLPVIILVQMFFAKMPRRKIITWQFFLWATLALHIAVRIMVSGSVAGNYGAGFFSGTWQHYASNFLKATGRTLVPPQHDPGRFVILSVSAIVIALLLLSFSWKKLRQGARVKKLTGALIIFILWAMIIPAWGGVSTRSSESDRFLEYPSYFICILGALILFHLFNNKKLLVAVSGVIIVVQIFFLEKNNLNWQHASDAVREIISVAKTKEAGQKIFVLNLPEEINGAYIFRNGFKEALQLNNVDTGSVVVLNSLQSLPPGGKLVYWENEKWVLQP